MEERKSVLETTKRADAYNTLETRQRSSRSIAITITAVVVLGLIFLIATIIHNTTRGTEGLRVPSVER